jgi:hypothetical protein
MRERKRDRLTTASAIFCLGATSSSITTVQMKQFGGQCSEYRRDHRSRRTKCECGSLETELEGQLREPVIGSPCTPDSSLVNGVAVCPEETLKKRRSKQLLA